MLAHDRNDRAVLQRRSSGMNARHAVFPALLAQLWPLPPKNAAFFERSLGRAMNSLGADDGALVRQRLWWSAPDLMKFTRGTPAPRNLEI